MENASKALLIAGTMLLMILVLSFATYLFGKISNKAANIYEDMNQSDITEFNQRFLNYNDKDNLKIQDVVSIINLAIDSNKSEKYPVNVKVIFWNEEWQKKSTTELNNLLTNSENINKRFKCVVEYKSNSVFVETVTILEI